MSFAANSIEEIEIGSGFTATIDFIEFGALNIALNVSLISGGAGVETLQIAPNSSFSAAGFNL